MLFWLASCVHLHAYAAQASLQDALRVLISPICLLTGNLLRLSSLTEGDAAQQLHQKATEAAGAFQERLEDMAMALPELCASLYSITTGAPRRVLYPTRMTRAKLNC